jgi:hypothetical protein
MLTDAGQRADSTDGDDDGDANADDVGGNEVDADDDEEEEEEDATAAASAKVVDGIVVEGVPTNVDEVPVDEVAVDSAVESTGSAVAASSHDMDRLASTSGLIGGVSTMPSPPPPLSSRGIVGACACDG